MIEQCTECSAMWTATASMLARLTVLAVMIHGSLAQSPDGYTELPNTHYKCRNENSTSLVASASSDCHDIGCCQSLCDKDTACEWFEFATGLSFCNGGGGCCWTESVDSCGQGMNSGVYITRTDYPGFTSYLKQPVCPQYPGYTSYAAKDRDGSDGTADLRNVGPESVPRLCDTNCACRGFNSAGWLKRWTYPLIDSIGSCFYIKDDQSGCAIEPQLPALPYSLLPPPPPIQSIPGALDTSSQDTSSSNVALAVGLAVGLGGAALLGTITTLVIVKRNRKQDLQAVKKPADDLSSSPSLPDDVDKVLVEVVRDPTVSDGDTSTTPNETTSNASSTLLTSGREVEVNVRSVFLMMAEQTCNARPLTSLEGVAVTPLSPLLDGLTLDVNVARDVVVNQAIGKGGHGAVHKGRYKHMDVAVKILPATDSMYIQELGILGRLRHPNIVSLLGAGVKGKQVYLIMDLADTSLDKLLYSNTPPFDVAFQPTPQPPPGRLLPLPLILSIAVQVSKGLTYLHPTVIHRDLKPPNILINKPNGSAPPVAKLTDFGLARMMASVVLQTGQPTVGTIAYMAPECFQNQKEGITCKADIYSFGICLWELLHGQLPWYQVDPGLILFKVVVQKTRPEFSVSQDRCPPDLRVLIEQCWDADASGRPNADDLLVQLSNMVQQSEKAA